MGYIVNSVQIVLLLLTNIFQTLAITSRLEHEIPSSRNFRRHISSHPFPDWELGLREAVYQALLRERNLDQNLREYMYSAPILGRQDSATPFGDIAILARGQLYSAPGGFQFVQDPYQNDCDGCHNTPPRCDRAPCENWRPQGHERLLALWTVKRIRHRDSNYGYRYELEYTVSPMNVAANEPFVTRNGRFDYSIPGHTFIVKANPRQHDPTFQNVNPHPDKVYRSYNSYDTNQWSPTFGPNFDGQYLPPPPLSPPLPPVEEYYDEDPRNAGYPNVLYRPPDRHTKRPHHTTKFPPTYDDNEDDEDLFKNFIDTLSTKTSTTAQTPSSTASTEPFLITQTSTTRHIFVPTAITRASPQPTTLTTSQMLSQTTDNHVYNSTYAQSPILPTIPMLSSLGTTKVLQMHKEGAPPTKPLFTPATVRFPTTTSIRSTTPLFQSYSTRTSPTTQFSESTPFVKYSEPDPLYDNSNTVTPTTPTLTSKLYPTRTTKQYKPTRRYKTTESLDFDIFEDKQETTEKSNRMKFPGQVNVILPPGEQVITVVKAPTITSRMEEHEAIRPNTEPSQSRGTPRKYHVDFNNTQLLQPEGESYITIALKPSTRVQQPLPPEVTLSTETSTGRLFTTKAIVPTRRKTTQQTLAEPTTASTDNIKSATRPYGSLSTERFADNDTSTITIPTRKTTETVTKVTLPLTHKTVPFRKTTKTLSRSTTTPPMVTALPTMTTSSPTMTTSSPTSKGILHSTDKSSTLSSTVNTSPLTKTTSLSTKPIPSKLTTRKLTLPSTTKSVPSTKTILPLTRTTSLLTSATSPMFSVTQTSPVALTTSNHITAPLSTTKQKQPTQTSEITISEETTHVPTISFETTNVPTTTDSTNSKSSETTILTTSVKITGFTTHPSVITTHVDTSSNIPTTTHGLSKLSIKPIRFGSTRTKSKIPTTYTTPMSTTILGTTEEEPTTLISKTSTKTTTHSTTTFVMTPLTKIPTQTTSFTTQATADNFLIESADDLVSKKHKTKPQNEDFDLDIFGKPQEETTSKSDNKKTQNHERFDSKEVDDIFGIQPEKKLPAGGDYNYDYDVNEPPASTTQKLKIIYSGFYSPSTSTEKATTVEAHHTTKAFVDTTTFKVETNPSGDLKNKTATTKLLTSQSYSTSVSFEVNKKTEATTPIGDFSTSNDFQSAPTTTSEEALYKKAGYKETTPTPCNVTEKNNTENNKILDALALSVVNHAKSIDYLNSNNNSSHDDSNREQKYKRKRIYRVQKLRRRTHV